MERFVSGHRVRLLARHVLAPRSCAAPGEVSDPKQWSKKPLDGPKKNLIKLDEVTKQNFGGGSSYQCIVGDEKGSTPVRFGVQVAPPGYATPSHSHPYMEIINVLEGKGYCWVEGVEGTVEISPGTTLALPAGLKHGFGATGTEPLKITGTHANALRIVDLEPDLKKPEKPELKPLEPWAKKAYIKHDEVSKQPFPNGATYQTLVGDEEGSTAVRIGVQTSPPGYATGTHSHPYMELVSVIEGTGVAWMEGVEGTVEIGPGTTLAMPPNVKHGFRNTGTGPLKTYGVHASGVRLTERFPDIPEPGR